MNPSPAGWRHGGGSVDQGTVALCFHDGGSFDYDHEGYPVRIQCDRLTVQFTYRFTALLGY